MRVLLLSQVFPPYPEVGAIRAANLVRAFREGGHHVTMITEALPGQPPIIPEGSGPAPRVVTVEHGVPLAVRLSRGFRRLPFRGAGVAGAEPVRKAVVEQLKAGKWRRFILAALAIPDKENYLIGTMSRAGSEVLREGSDLIYSTAPPFSIHLSARRLSRRYRIPWVAEFRDPWHYPGMVRTAGVHPLTQHVDRYLERRVLTTADAMVMVTEAARQHVAQRLPESYRDRFILARNGVPDWSPRMPAAHRGPFRVVHAGSLYMWRNPAAFFEGVARYVKRLGLTPEQLLIEFIGSGRDYRGVSVPGMVSELGLERFVRFEDWLPHAEVRERLLTADALLLFAQGQPLQVPNKLYEYLAVQRPILAFVDRDGESRSILQGLPQIHLFFDEDPEPVVDALAQLLSARAGPPPVRSAIRFPESLLTSVQMRNLVDELETRFGHGQLWAR